VSRETHQIIFVISSTKQKLINFCKIWYWLSWI